MAFYPTVLSEHGEFTINSVQPNGLECPRLPGDMSLLERRLYQNFYRKRGSEQFCPDPLLFFCFFHWRVNLARQFSRFLFRIPQPTFLKTVQFPCWRNGPPPRRYTGISETIGGEAMRVAVIGSRKLKIEHLERYLPKETTEIVSGVQLERPIGIDTYA